VLDEGHLYSGIRYVENNPVRAKIANNADEYRWSSARSHMHGTVDAVLSNDCTIIESVRNWSAYLQEREDTQMTEAIRQNTRTGRPCGGGKFVLRMEELLGRSLNAMPRGRPHRLSH
jgi:putative transposase